MPIFPGFFTIAGARSGPRSTISRDVFLDDLPQLLPAIIEDLQHMYMRHLRNKRIMRSKSQAGSVKLLYRIGRRFWVRRENSSNWEGKRPTVGEKMSTRDQLTGSRARCILSTNATVAANALGGESDTLSPQRCAQQHNRLAAWRQGVVLSLPRAIVAVVAVVAVVLVMRVAAARQPACVHA